MKTFCKHTEIDEGLVRAAIAEWRSKDSGKKNYWRIEDEYGCIDNLVSELISEIHSRTLSFTPIRKHTQIEPINGKHRVIGVESVKQQIAGYIVILAAEELFERKLGFYQMSSVKGKGQLKSAQVISKWVKSPKAKYWIHADVRQCYPSISPALVYKVYSKYIRNRDILYVIETLLSTYDEGLNIGSFFALKTCQLILSFGYHYVEELHYSKRGKTHQSVWKQLWYADDIYFLGSNKKELSKAMKALEVFLHNNLGLSLKPWKVCKIDDNEPIEIAGFVVHPNKMRIKSKIFLRARKMFRLFQRRRTLKRARSICAYWGWFKYANSYNVLHRTNMLDLLRYARKFISRRSLSCQL